MLAWGNLVNNERASLINDKGKNFPFKYSSIVISDTSLD